MQPARFMLFDIEITGMPIKNISWKTQEHEIIQTLDIDDVDDIDDAGAIGLSMDMGPENQKSLGMSANSQSEK